MARTRRIHVTGASGAGVTTLGRALAGRFAIPLHDTDDYYWLPEDPPFAAKRPIAERLRLMEAVFLARPHWVLSGSLDGWGDPLVPFFDVVVFVTAPAATRRARLAAREALRFGEAAVAPGGWRRPELEAFLDWSDGYDAGDRPGRSRARHEAWLARLPCPVLRVEGTRPVAELAAVIPG